MNFLDSLEGRYGNAYAREFRDVITRFAPNASRFLEWGSGESTGILCDLAARQANPIVLSIDDHREYQLSIAKSLPNYAFLHFRCLDLQGPSLSQEDQYPSYSSYPFFIGMEFDVVFVDGRRRAECALTAAQVVRADGIVIVHDWRRSRYATIRALFETIFEGEQFLVLKPSAIRLSQKPGSKEQRVIIVPARGARATRELAITRPNAEAYAKEIGADFVVVGEASMLPAHRLKYEAVEVARAYDRALVIDADVLIRPGSPDIFSVVPERYLGAFPEGSFFPRQDWCAALSETYGLSEPLQPSSYFNTGVLVLSRKHLPLLMALEGELIWGHPQFEQGFLNAKRVALGIPLYPLTPDFNYIPDGGFTNDFRFAFFLHYAGAGRDSFEYKDLWEDITGTLTTFSKRGILSGDVRAGLLRAASERMNGNIVHLFDPTDFSYNNKYAQPIFRRDGAVVVFFSPVVGDAERHLSVWGPYVDLEPGRWRAQLQCHDGSGFVYGGAAVELVKNHGEISIVEPGDWPENGQFEFELTEAAKAVEIRIYRSGTSAELSWFRLEKLATH